MAESLKAMRERFAREDCGRKHEFIYYKDDCWECRENAKRNRELQKQAMVAAIRHVAALHIKHYGLELGVKCYSAAEVDWVLDAPSPAFPVRCIHCGQIEEAHAIVAHAFKAQSPHCHRAHPHSEPCAPALLDGPAPEGE